VALGAAEVGAAKFVALDALTLDALTLGGYGGWRPQGNRFAKFLTHDRNWPVCEISRTCQKRLVIGVLQTRFCHIEFFAF